MALAFFCSWNDSSEVKRAFSCFRSDDFRNVNKFVLDWSLVSSCEIQTNEVNTKYKRYQVLLCVVFK